MGGGVCRDATGAGRGASSWGNLKSTFQRSASSLSLTILSDSCVLQGKVQRVHSLAFLSRLLSTMPYSSSNHKGPLACSYLVKCCSNWNTLLPLFLTNSYTSLKAQPQRSLF